MSDATPTPVTPAAPAPPPAPTPSAPPAWLGWVAPGVSALGAVCSAVLLVVVFLRLPAPAPPAFALALPEKVSGSAGEWVVVPVRVKAPKAGVFALTAGWDKHSAKTTVTVADGPAPPIPPGPNPPPNPPPAPGTLSFWVIVVSDKTAALPDLANLLNAPTLRQALAAGGHTFRWYDQKQDQVARLGYDKQVIKAGGAPALILLQKGGPDDGKVLSAVRVPGSGAAILDTIHKAGGK